MSKNAGSDRRYNRIAENRRHAVAVERREIERIKDKKRRWPNLELRPDEQALLVRSDDTQPPPHRRALLIDFHVQIASHCLWLQGQGEKQAVGEQTVADTWGITVSAVHKYVQTHRARATETVRALQARSLYDMNWSEDRLQVFCEEQRLPAEHTADLLAVLRASQREFAYQRRLEMSADDEGMPVADLIQSRAIAHHFALLAGAFRKLAE